MAHNFSLGHDVQAAFLLFPVAVFLLFLYQSNDSRAATQLLQAASNPCMLHCVHFLMSSKGTINTEAIKTTIHFLISTEAGGAPLFLLAQNSDGSSSLLLKHCFQLIHSQVSRGCGLLDICCILGKKRLPGSLAGTGLQWRWNDILQFKSIQGYMLRWWALHQTFPLCMSHICFGPSLCI